MTAPSVTYHIAAVDPVTHKEQVVALWVNGFDALSEMQAGDKLAWTHQHNPAGSGLMCLMHASSSETAVGVQSLGHRRWFAGATAYDSVILGDFVVDKAHRSLGPAMQLQRAALQISEHQFSFAYGFPNKKSEPVLQRIGVEKLGAAVRYARVIRSTRFLRDKLPAWLLPVVAPVLDAGLAAYDAVFAALNKGAAQGEWLTRFDDRFDRLWQQRGLDDYVMSDRSAAVLNWRYSQQGVTPQIFAVSEHGELLGYVVVMLRESVVVVSDFLVRAPLRHNLRRVKALFLHEVRRMNFETVSLEFFGGDEVVAVLNSLHFRARETHPFYFRPAQGGCDVRDNQWYVTGFDRDTH